MLVLGTEVAKNSVSWAWFIQTDPSRAIRDKAALPSSVR